MRKLILSLILASCSSAQARVLKGQCFQLDTSTLGRPDEYVLKIVGTRGHLEVFVMQHNVSDDLRLGWYGGRTISRRDLNEYYVPARCPRDGKGLP